MEYTKGEWKVRETNLGYLVVIESPDRTKQDEIQITLVPMGKEQKTNARLIAAAPDLYEALKELRSEYQHWTSQYHGGSVDRVNDLVKKALAKAGGK